MHTIEKLQWIDENDYRVPEGYEALDAVREVVKNFRSEHSELRDDYSYGILYYWIYEQPVLEKKELQMLVDELLNERVLLGEGRKSFFADESEELVEIKDACQKAFIPLLFCLLLGADGKNAFLTKEQTITLFNQVIEILDTEKNATSFHPEYGWIHIYAHVADLCLELSKNTSVNSSQVEQLAERFLGMISRGSQVFDGAEEERISQMFTCFINKEKISVDKLLKLFEVELMKARLMEYPRIGFQALKIVGRTLVLQLLQEGINVTKEWQKIEDKVNKRVKYR